MTADSVAVTDAVIREIGEQVFLTLRRKMPRWGGMRFDVADGISLYRGHLRAQGVYFGAHSDINRNRYTKSGSINQNPKLVEGQAFEIVDVADRNARGEEVKRTADNSPQTDAKGYDANGRPISIQHKRLTGDSSTYFREFREDIENDQFVVPSEQFDGVRRDLEKRIRKGGKDERDAERILKGLRKGPQSSDSKRPHTALAKRQVQELANQAKASVGRSAVATATGVASDLAMFAAGGAAMEIREAYRHPDDMPLLDRCVRLVRAIWERLLASLKDRSLREVGSEAITALASVLTAPLRMVKSAVESIVDVLRRLWMDFVDGRLKTPADVIAAGLKAVFAVASVGVATALESEFEALFGAVPVVGEILPALCAAVVAGVMIVVGNRAIDHIVRSLFAMFQSAEVARRRREETEAFCAEQIPRLIADRNHLEALVETHLTDREALFACTFADLKSARDSDDMDGFLNGLQKLNQAYGKTLPWRTHREFDDFMLDDSQSLKL